MEETFQSVNECESISSSPDFAQVYIFIKNFGILLKLPYVTIKGLEDFFISGYQIEDNQVAYIQWRLLTASCRGSRAEWQRSAVKFARRHGLCGKDTLYAELSILNRLKLFRLSCEDQFDYNLTFKNELKKDGMMDGMMGRPLLGLDSKGQKHWLLRDSVHDIRLYGESRYDEEPPKSAEWVELVRTLDGLADYIAILESTRGASTTSSQELQDSPLGMLSSTNMSSSGDVPDDKSRRKSQTMTKKSKTSKKPLWDGDKSIEGCIKCRKDIDYKQMLLCDECDRECHTYCQYPRLWQVPNGKWICPICKEGHLIEELRRVYFESSSAKTSYEKSVERKQRSIARLQRTGLLVQNIIMDESKEEDLGRRSRRSRKEINYAELNDVQLPRLGRHDYVGSIESTPPAFRPRRTRPDDQYIHEDYLMPRIRSSNRRFRGDLENTPSPINVLVGDSPIDVDSVSSSNTEQKYELSDKEELLYEGDSESFERELTVTFQRNGDDSSISMPPQTELAIRIGHSRDNTPSSNKSSNVDDYENFGSQPQGIKKQCIENVTLSENAFCGGVVKDVVANTGDDRAIQTSSDYNSNGAEF